MGGSITEPFGNGIHVKRMAEGGWLFEFGGGGGLVRRLFYGTVGVVGTGLLLGGGLATLVYADPT